MRFFPLLLLLLVHCRQASPPQTRFTLLPASQTGLLFENNLPYSDSLNCYLFRNFYNGGGVGIADVNNDGLPDIFLCGNLTPSKLFLNRGNLRFEDVTAAAGLPTDVAWTTGVAFADVDGNGNTDLYLCHSGPPGGPRRANELFLNQGTQGQPHAIPHFTENAQAWRLDFNGLSTHAAFFDYDRDGDLDCYLLNNSLRSVGGYDFRPGQRNLHDAQGSNQLLRHDGPPQPNGAGGFTDVSRQAGIFTSAIGFGLGVTVGDYDADGWEDLFISNDFFERDYLYHNERNGTFKEVLETAMAEISKGSMGADMADLDNDGLPEIFVTEMLPASERRLKTKAAFDNWPTFHMMLENGYHRQFGRNVLQHNRGDGTFAEVGRMAGVSATDWSWGALLADFDNDGLKDIFVANGIGKDLLDQDYLNFYSDPATVRQVLRDNPGQGIKTLIDAMPSEPQPNALFHHTGNLNFENVANAWGLAQPSFSNGAAWADLDNDGDLDLVVNNANMPAFLYRNNTDNTAHWLKIKPVGPDSRTIAFGAKADVFAGGVCLSVALNPMRGFQSSVEPILHVGLGTSQQADSVWVAFPNGRRLRFGPVKADQTLLARQIDATTTISPKNTAQRPFFQPSEAPAFLHRESEFSDFDLEPLLLRMNSAEGPALTAADVNRDGLEDLFVGGAAGQASALFLATPAGGWKRSHQPDIDSWTRPDCVDAAFFDADDDGDQDLYAASGSSEFQPGDPALQDRLYRNDGNGHFHYDPTDLPSGKPFASSCVRPADVDGDGDADLFVGMSLIPGHYGLQPASFLMKNDGKGHFKVDPQPAFLHLGMVHDATWLDIDGDRDPDLFVAAEWEPLRLLRNDNGRFTDISDAAGLAHTDGWWYCCASGDFNGDGLPDLAAGNHGLNSFFKASLEHPLDLYTADFDDNGQSEPLVFQFKNDGSYPIAQRNDLLRQLPGLKKKYLKFEAYAGQKVSDILPQNRLQQAVHRQATVLESVFLINKGNGRFEWKTLPQAAQVSPVFALLASDVTGDGLDDLLLAGNDERCKPESGAYLASQGAVVPGRPAQEFGQEAFPAGFSEIPVRNMAWVRRKGAPARLIVAHNNASLTAFRKGNAGR